MEELKMNKLNNMLKLCVVGLFMQFAFADPGWDPAGECFLNNYNDYEFNGSVTAKVYEDGAESGQLGDLVAVFHGEEHRGVGCASEVPVFLGNGFAFLTMVYSNNTGGEELTFQHYDESENTVYNVYSEDGWDDDDNSETPNTHNFTTNMVIGDVTTPLELTFTVGDGGGPSCDDVDADGICDDVDDCVGAYDECGVCNGDGIADGACDC
ncbi:uncharacterized protein METZ01_LOCUS480648, partial [marine metagenome]